MTARDLIASSMRLINALAAGEAPTDTEQAEALIVLNQMVDQWAAERLNIFVSERAVFSLVSGQQMYTLGTGGNFNRVRPSYINGVTVISLNNPAQPLELPLDMYTEQQWIEIPVKNVASALPTLVYVETAFPLLKLYYWPIPNVGNLQTALYVPTALNAFADLTTNYTFPNGYEKALRFSLAIELAGEYGREVPPVVSHLQVQAMTTIKRKNVSLIELRSDPALVGPPGIYDWRTDK